MILLIIIYLAFISLGLPDSILGSAWPAIQSGWSLPLDAAGWISFLVVGSTIISSFLSGKVIKRFGTGKVTMFSCLMTGLALLGFSFAPSYIWLLVFAIPLGLGGGSVDAALNNYVATHYHAHHMNWLHSFWGVGATLGPIIMAGYLATSWQTGFRTISLLQLTLAAVLILTISLWPKKKEHIEDVSKSKGVFKIKGVKYALAIFLFYCAVEFSLGLWGSSYLVQIKGLTPATGARFVALYYGGITVGRMISGFLSFKLTNKQLILIGIYTAFVGIVLLVLPLPSWSLIIAMPVIGLGLAPIFPSMIHETPKHFGKDVSQTIVGYQMAFGGIGSAFLPPTIGFIVSKTSLGLFPYLLMLAMVVLHFSAQKLLHLKVN